MQDDDVIRELLGDPHLVRDENQRLATLSERSTDREERHSPLRVERARGLIEKERSGIHGKRSRDGDALLLSTAHLPRIRVRPVGEPNLVEEIARAQGSLFWARLFHMNRSFDDIAERGPMREESVVLEDEADAPPNPGERGFLAAEGTRPEAMTKRNNVPRVVLLEAYDAAQKRGFTPTRRANDRRDASLLETRRNPGENPASRVLLGQPACRDDGRDPGRDPGRNHARPSARAQRESG